MDEDGFARLAAAEVAVVGLGLMGGSLALALRSHCRSIVGVDPDPRACALALECGAVDRAAELDGALAADVLILAAPVRAITALVQDFARRPALEHPTVLLDLGSTKAQIVAAMQALPSGWDPLGGHPMCGKEVSGLAHAEASLFRDKLFVLTPLARTSPKALSLARALVAAVGARPLALSPDRHDTLAAHSSHLPYLAAALLVRAAEAAGDPQVWQLAASGFRDTSRLAASDVTMMLDILLTNRSAILAALERYQAEAATLSALLQDGAVEALRDFLTQAFDRRRGLFQ
ncbi:MAG: prephenate dehydrogenase [Anaerolineales bacterium]|nr:prephenate dehydrogenase [Anaerolineales bacterium]